MSLSASTVRRLAWNLRRSAALAKNRLVQPLCPSYQVGHGHLLAGIDVPGRKRSTSTRRFTEFCRFRSAGSLCRAELSAAERRVLEAGLETKAPSGADVVRKTAHQCRHRNGIIIAHFADEQCHRSSPVRSDARLAPRLSDG